MTAAPHFYLNEERRLIELTEQPHSRQAVRKLFTSDAQEKVGTTKAQRAPRGRCMPALTLLCVLCALVVKFTFFSGSAR